MRPKSERKAWLRHHRLACGWTPDDVAAAMTAAGYRTARGAVLVGGSVRTWEAPGGAEPGRKALACLEGVFGDRAPADELTLATRKDRELAALRELLRAVETDDHGKGIAGVQHYPCSLCDAVDEVRAARR